MSHPLHHISLRKRVHLLKQSYPHKVKWKRLLDNSIVWLGVGNIFATIPQLGKIWLDKDAAGVSTISWAYYSFFSVIFLLYGIAHKEKPIILSYVGSTVLYSLIFIGSVIY